MTARMSRACPSSPDTWRTPMTYALVLILVLFLLLSGLPIFAALAITGSAILLIVEGHLHGIADTAYYAINNPILVTIPLFVLVAQVMMRMGVIDWLFALVRAGNYTEVGGYHASCALFSTDKPLTGLFAANDLIALGVLGAARERGLEAGRDFALVELDDISLAVYDYVSLTTVSYSRNDAGRIARELIQRRCQNADAPAETGGTSSASGGSQVVATIGLSPGDGKVQLARRDNPPGLREDLGAVACCRLRIAEAGGQDTAGLFECVPG
jgi:Transcriptional regulators